MDRIAAMNTFVRVVEAGSFTKAAETLDVPNATVTRQVQALERELKVRLLHRTTRSLTVTAEGATYYERIKLLLAELADIESTARQSQAKPSGRVKVQTASAILTSVLMPALAEFREAYPDIEVELGVGNKFTDLVAEGIDCAIRTGQVDDEFLVARRVGRFRFMTCASPEFLRTHEAPRTPEELVKLQTVGLVTARGGRPLAFRYSSDAGKIELALNHAVIVNDVNAYLSAGLVGLGVIQAPSYSVHEALKAGHLVSLLEDVTPRPTSLHVVYAPNRYLSAKVRVFIDWLVTVFERHECTRLG